jgi:hypothetical protein
MTNPKGTRALLDLHRAAEAVGVGTGAKRPAQVLQRLLEAREREVGHPIMLRISGTGRGVRYRVALATLRDHCPELFSNRDEMAEMLREKLEDIDDRITDLYQRDTAIAREVAALKRVASKFG